MGLDLVLLIDRSISNSYAVGSDTATPAGDGQVRRWDLITAAIERFLNAPEVASNQVSLTFASYTGSATPATECSPSVYANAVVALDTAAANAAPILSAMQSVNPAGLSPLVPALTGAFQYAMSEQRQDPQREKAVVFLGDGFPSMCDLKSPSDVTKVISEAAAAVTPIRTFIIAVGSPDTLAGARFNLLNYARQGNTGKQPYVIDETVGVDGARSQLTTTLLDIAATPANCAYQVTATSPGQVALTYRFNDELREIPYVSSVAACATAARGGWYFDNPVAPSSVRVCPCTCSSVGTGQLTLAYGCAPVVVTEE